MNRLFNYFKESFARKRARRVFREYETYKESFVLEDEGTVEFYNSTNPLMQRMEMYQDWVDFFKRYIPKGSLAIDIGTNIGDTTVPMALAAGAEGIVLGFDPNPHVYKIAVQNAGLNKDKTNIVMYPHAITDNDADFYYSSSEASFANGGISQDESTKHGKFTLGDKVHGVNLASFLDKNHPGWKSRLSFIKIDTEGHDKEIIRSIHDLLKENKPTIVAECVEFLSESEKRELYEMVVGIGYKISFFEYFGTNGKEFEINSFDEFNNIKGMFNFIAEAPRT